MTIQTRQDIIDAESRGVFPEWLFFWRTEDPTKIESHVLSPGYFADFEVDGVLYPSFEHWMVAEKARVLCDDEIYQAVLQDMESPNLERVRELGRQIKSSDSAMWEAHKVALAVQGAFAKFSQNRTIGRYLLGTDNKILVHADPIDCVWGIGVPQGSPQSFDPRQWRGSNLLGFVLMEVRNDMHFGG